MDPAPPASPPAPRRGLSPSVVVPLLLVALLCGVVFVAASIAYVAPGIGLPLLSRSLPGLSVSLPPGLRTDGSPGDYRLGWLRVGGPLQRYYVHLNWHPGGPLAGDEVVRILNGVAAQFGGSDSDPRRDVEVTVPGHAEARSALITLPGGGEVWHTMLLCGVRRVMINTAGRPPAIERLHRRVAASFVCRADAARDALLADMPVALDQPTGWRRTKKGVDLLELTNGPYKLIVRSFGGQVPDEVMDEVAPRFPGAKVGKRDVSDWPIDGAEMHGWMTLRRCPDRNETLSIVASHPEGSAGVNSQWTRSILRDVRCRRPDEAAQVFPEAAR